MKTEVHCLGPDLLEHFLVRRRRSDSTLASETALASELSRILEMSNEFVPSQAGSILLDDPGQRSAPSPELTFIAAFGEKAPQLIGRRILSTDGIAGHVYRVGETYSTSKARDDAWFYADIDEAIEFRTESLIAVPIRLGDQVCGVLELIRGRPFERRSRELLEVFASYISVAMQNLLDVRHARAIAQRDDLTGLYNDRHLHVALESEIERCRAGGCDLTLLFLDLDYFKRINDRYGHLAGSQVLREVGAILADSVADRGLCARYGGDEFVVVLPEIDLGDGVEIAERLRQQILEATFCSGGGDIQPEPLWLRGQAASLGAASLRHHVDVSEPPERAKTTLLHVADAAMYVAKETGRNRTAVAAELVRGEPVPGVIEKATL